MKYPIISLTSATLIWLLLIIIVSYKFYNNQTTNPAQIIIDSSLITLNKSPSIKEEARNISPQIRNLPSLKEYKKIRSIPNNLSNSNHISEHKTYSQEGNNNKQAIAVYRPLPAIPDELRQEAFNSYALARFYINKDGSTRVELLKPSANPKLNQLLLQQLHKWKFTPQQKMGLAIDSIQDIKVEFIVK